MSLLTDRLKLDPLEPGDLERFTELHAGERETEFLSPPRPLTASESFRLLCQVLGHAQIRGFGYWAVRRRVDAEWLGMVGLWWPEGWPGVELGWRFGEKHWGRGYALEAARAVLDVARQTHGLDSLISIIHAGNTRSARLAAKLGMTPWQERTVGDVSVTIFRWLAQAKQS